MDVVIVSSDKDMLQLVTDRVSMLNPMKDDMLYDPAKTEEFMGVPPASVADLLALKGDSIETFRARRASATKARGTDRPFGTVENAIERAAEVERKMYRESLQNHKDQILMSKKLATIDTQTPVEWCLESLSAQEAGRPGAEDDLSRVGVFQPPKGTRARRSPPHDKDYQTLLEAEEVDEFVAEIPAALRSPSRSRPGIGLAYKQGQARGIPFELAGPVYNTD